MRRFPVGTRVADTRSGAQSTVIRDYHDTAMRGCVATRDDAGTEHDWVPVQNLERAR
jgi:hypothetical protein